MLAHIPLPQPDQTMESLAAWAALNNGLSDRRTAARTLFRVSDHRHIGRPYHHGSMHLFDALGGAGFQSCSDFLDSHGFIGFFKPFALRVVYERAREKLIRDNSHGIATLLSANGLSLFADELRYCSDCALQEFRSLGFAYAHRTHQVLGVTNCLVHGTRLGILPREVHGITSMWGLLAFNCNSRSLDDFFLREIESPESGAASSRFGTWVDAVFGAQLVATEADVRQRLIKAKLDAMPKGQNLPNSQPARLEQVIRNHYPEYYLSHVGLPTRTGPTAHWPSLFIGSQQFSGNAVANLLILSALFESPQDFNEAANAVAKTTSSAVPRIARISGLPRIEWSLGLVKDILRMPLLDAIASKHGIHAETLVKRLRSNPELVSRRKLNLWRSAKKHHRLTLTRALVSDPSINRFQFRRAHFSAYQWLMTHDRRWFAACLRPSGNRWAEPDASSIAHIQRSGDDERVALLLRQCTEGWISGPVPLRITKARLLNQTPEQVKRHLFYEAYPLTAKALSELVETTSRYEYRVIERMTQLVSQGDLVGAKRWATSLIAQFPHRSDIVAKVVDLLLSLAAHQPAQGILQAA